MAAEYGPPVRWRWAAAHSIVLALALFFAHAQPGGAAPILLATALPLALELSSLRLDAAYATWLMATISGAVALWLVSEGDHPSHVGFPLMLATIGAFQFLFWMRRSGPRPLLLLLGIEVALVAFFSGGHGSGDAMVRWLTDHGLNDQAAHLATLAFRKTVHFTFYGSVGWTVFRAAQAADSPLGRAARTGILAALSLAAFDELRQSGYANRTGSAWDVLLDLAGASTLVGLSVLKERTKR